LDDLEKIRAVADTDLTIAKSTRLGDPHPLEIRLAPFDLRRLSRFRDARVAAREDLFANHLRNDA
jgi:hypothetical protein